jgi:hypothetical protein
MITKVKHCKGLTTIRWRDVRMEEVVEHEMKSSEDPRPELLTAIAAFVPFVIEICEFPDAWDEAITISGISLSEVEMNDKKMIGIVITSMKRLELTPSPVLINTPFLLDEAWPKGLQKAVEKLEAEALRFRDGDRAQQVLPGTPTKNSRKAEQAIIDGLNNLQKLADKDGTTLSLGVNGEEKVIIHPRNGKVRAESRA